MLADDLAGRVAASARRWISARQTLRGMEFDSRGEAAQAVFEMTVAEDAFWSEALRRLGVDIDTRAPIPGVIPPRDLSNDDRLRIAVFAIINRVALRMMVQARSDAGRSGQDPDGAVCAAFLATWENADYLNGHIVDRVADERIRERAMVALAGAVRSRIHLGRAKRLRQAMSADQRPADVVLAERLPEAVLEAWKTRNEGEGLGAVRTTVSRQLAREGRPTASRKDEEGHAVRIDREVTLRDDHLTDAFDPLEEMAAFEVAVDVDEWIEEALASIPRRQREVYRLHHHEGLTHREIATRLGITRNGSKSNLAKAKQSLVRVLKDRGLLTDVG